MTLPCLLSVLCLSMAAMAMAPAHADVDPQNGPGRLGLNLQAATMNWQQEVRATHSGLLTQVDLFLQGPDTLQSFEFYVNRGAGWQDDAPEFEALITPALGQVSIDVSLAGLMLQAGDAFVLGVAGIGPAVDCCNLQGTVGNAYASGQLWLNGSASDEDYDMSFRALLYAVPEPSSDALMAFGLIGLGLASGRHARMRAIPISA